MTFEKAEKILLVNKQKKLTKINVKYVPLSKYLILNTVDFLHQKPKTLRKSRKCLIFTVTYISAYYFLKCHTFFSTVIFYFFLSFLDFD